LTAIMAILAAGCENDTHRSGSIKVLDGDTFITASGETVRLLGIDAPEKEQNYYLEAGQLLGRTLERGEVRLEFDEQRFDRYGRTLAYVFAGGVFVNQALLDSGLAVVYSYQTNSKHRNELADAQMRARNALKNLWSVPVANPCEYYLATLSSLRFHRPECNSIRGRPVAELRRFQTRDEALDEGLSPCRNCKP